MFTNVTQISYDVMMFSYVTAEAIKKEDLQGRSYELKSFITQPQSFVFLTQILIENLL